MYRTNQPAVLLAALGVVLLGNSPCPAQEAGKRRPNIVLIMADDFGHECVAVNGGTSYKTPRLDALAARGFRFTHCYATPLCTPSRTQIMTGRYNFRNYVRFGEFDFQERTFAHVLRAAGYATCIVGKWQLGGGLKGPQQAGFDDYCLWQIFKENMGSRYAFPKIHRNGELLKGLEKRYGPDVFLEHAEGFITRNKGRPFFLYWPMVLTHGPFDPTPDSPAGARPANVKNFPEMVTYLDRCVGKLVDHLERLGLRENTLILFTGDNGSPRQVVSTFEGRRLQGAKGTTTRAGTRVPLIVSWPGRAAAGKVCDDLIDFTDILPTLADAAGATLPKGVALDGRSFLPQLLGKKGEPRAHVFCHYEPRQGKKKEVKTRFAHDHRWKLYQDGRLFDMDADADERQALPQEGAAEAREARRRLQAVLDRMERERPFGK
jgi:arylsulfatase A